MNINVFLLFFSFVLLQIERERVYTKFGIRRNSPKGTYLISLMEFRGESFFFYGLIDFMLFLILSWRKWLLQVSQNFFVFFYPEYLALVLSPTNPVQRLTFLPLTGRSPHFRFRVPANRFTSAFPCQATRVRSPSINIRPSLWPIFFLNGHSLMAWYC